MADIIAFKRPKAGQRHKGKTLCRHGHHKWVVEKDNVFDSKQGRLVTRYRCARCGQLKIKAH